MNTKYTAHITLCQAGEEIVLHFSNLSKKDAEAIHRVVDKNYSHITSSADVISYGWEEQK
jgi:hypothetical protein